MCWTSPRSGLHARDNRILLSALSKLRERGNSLVVVEHDEETIRAADHLIDMGPGRGHARRPRGGTGTIQDIIANPQSVTGRFLREPPRRKGGPRHSAAGRRGAPDDPRREPAQPARHRRRHPAGAG